MIRPRAIVKRKQLITNGFFITTADDTVAVMPFDDDVNYQFRLTVSFDQEDRVRNSIKTAEDGVLEISHFRPEGLVLPTASRPKESFAHDDTYSYYLSYSVLACRSPAGTIFQVNYCVLREAN